MLQTFLRSQDLDANLHNIGSYHSTEGILGAEYFRGPERQTDGDFDLAFGGTCLCPKRGQAWKDA